jgi:hypothetical protein
MISEPPECQIWWCNCHFTYVCGTTEVHKQGTPEVLFYVPGVHYIHMYLALRLFNLHLQFNFPSVLLLMNKL